MPRSKYPRVLTSNEGDALIIRSRKSPALFLSAHEARQWAECRYISRGIEVQGPIASLLLHSLSETRCRFAAIRGVPEDPILRYSLILTFSLPNDLRIAVVLEDLLVVVHHDRFSRLDVDLVVGPSFFHATGRRPSMRSSIDDVVTHGAGSEQSEDPADNNDCHLLSLYLNALQS